MAGRFVFFGPHTAKTLNCRPLIPDRLGTAVPAVGNDIPKPWERHSQAVGNILNRVFLLSFPVLSPICRDESLLSFCKDAGAVIDVFNGLICQIVKLCITYNIACGKPLLLMVILFSDHHNGRFYRRTLN